MGTIYRPLVQLDCCACKQQNMNLHAFKIRGEFCEQWFGGETSRIHTRQPQ